MPEDGSAVVIRGQSGRPRHQLPVFAREGKAIGLAWVSAQKAGGRRGVIQVRVHGRPLPAAGDAAGVLRSGGSAPALVEDTMKRSALHHLQHRQSARASGALDGWEVPRSFVARSKQEQRGVRDRVGSPMSAGSQAGRERPGLRTPPGRARPRSWRLGVSHYLVTCESGRMPPELRLRANRACTRRMSLRCSRPCCWRVRAAGRCCAS